MSSSRLSGGGGGLLRWGDREGGAATIAGEPDALIVDLVLPNRPLPTLGWCCGALATGRWGSCRRRDEGRKETGAAQSGEDMEKVVRWRGTSGGTSLARRVSVWREQLQPVAGTGRASMPSFEKIASPQILPHTRALSGVCPVPSSARRRHGLAANQAPCQPSADPPRWAARRT